MCVSDHKFHSDLTVELVVPFLHFFAFVQVLLNFDDVHTLNICSQFLVSVLKVILLARHKIRFSLSLD